MKTYLLRCGVVILSFISLLLITLTILIHTESGSRWLITQVTRPLSTELHIGKIQGRLSQVVVLSDLNYHYPGTTITADKVIIDWHMMTLIKRKLSITRMKADAVKIRFNPIESTTKDNTALAMPNIRIHLRDTEISQLSITSPALSAPIVFNNSRLNAKIYPELLSVQIISKLTRPSLMNIRLEAFGKLTGYQIALVIEQAKNRWSLQADGDLNHLQFQTKENQLLGGTIKLLGNISFGPKQQWVADADIKSINPQLLFPNWPGKINFKVKSRVEKKNIDIALTDLNGSLKQRRVAGELHYQQVDHHDHLIMSDLHFGNASIIAKGKINDNIDLKWDINIPQLQDLLAEYTLSGSLVSQGTLVGPRTLPNIKGTIKGHQIHFAEWAAENLQVNANYQNNQQPIQLQIDLNNVHHGEHALGNVQGQLMGTQSHHTIQLKYTRQDNSLKLNATGNFSNAIWQGTLDNVTVTSPHIHNWHLQSATPLSLSAEAFHIAPLCLLNDKVALCLNSQWQKDGTFTADIKGNKIPLDMLNPLIGDLNLHGEMSAVAKYIAIPHKTPVLDLNVALAPGVFHYIVDDVSRPFNYQGGVITAQLNEHKFVAKAALELLQKSKLTANVYADPAHWKQDNWLTNPIHGDFNITVPQLDFLAVLIPKIAQTRGSATGHGTIGGTLQNPEISGSANLANASFHVPDVSGEVKKMTATGSLHQGLLSYQGVGSAGDGTFKISGTTQLIKNQLHTHLQLQGKNMLISDTPGVKVTATPDLQMNIVDKVMSLTGKIFIPKGELRSYDYNDTLTLPDEITYRQQTPLKPTEYEPVQLTSSIELKLGDNITIDSNGLKGKLVGSFTLHDIPGGATTAFGNLAMSEGKYDFRGQNLTVERGILNFNGGPISNPNLNVRAVRKIGTFGVIQSVSASDQNRSVGIYITGTLAKHTLTLFSEPDDISQSDILSYLVLGQSVGSVSGSKVNAQALLGAAQALNLSGTGGTLAKFKSQLEQKLGLTELDITSYETKAKDKSSPESTIQHTAFVLGRYLSPKLYVNYSFDILDHTNVFRIRYFLNKKWSVQSESSSEGNALDILYSFERE